MGLLFKILVLWHICGRTLVPVFSTQGGGGVIGIWYGRPPLHRVTDAATFPSSVHALPDRHSIVNHRHSNIVSTYAMFKLFIYLQSFIKYFYNKRTKATLFVFFEGILIFL